MKREVSQSQTEKSELVDLGYLSYYLFNGSRTYLTEGVMHLNCSYFKYKN